MYKGAKCRVTVLLLADTTAVMWRSILNYTGWDVVMTKGSAAGTLDTTWFRDSSFGGCGLTSLNAQVPSGVCKMTFRVSQDEVKYISAVQVWYVHRLRLCVSSRACLAMAANRLQGCMC